MRMQLVKEVSIVKNSFLCHKCSHTVIIGTKLCLHRWISKIVLKMSCNGQCPVTFQSQSKAVSWITCVYFNTEAIIHLPACELVGKKDLPMSAEPFKFSICSVSRVNW